MSNYNIDVSRISALVVAAVSVALFIFAHISGRKKERGQDTMLLAKYPSIYRVITLPSAGQCILKAEGASVEVGDCGWEAEPVCQNGLIYLHGLNDQWQVVWYAGFRPEEVEVVGPKPRSQYYIFPYWRKNNIPQCPFPVKQFKHGTYRTAHFGFPVQVRTNWVQGQKIDWQPT
jgi:hypothetical protein